MSARDEILANLRKLNLAVPMLPTLDADWVRFDKPVEQFATMCTAVGGTVVPVPDKKAAIATISALPVIRDAKRVCSFARDILAGNVDLDAESDPHDLETLDVTLAEAILGVAENGALWFDSTFISQRTALFIAQHVVLVVTKETIVHNMHEAYARITSPRPGYGVFVAGPSKTADIEQSLVIGAHGARSATVLVVG
ncbi:MAG: LUD domain-containing protein [Deltaproteobacteria bacterium]|nr:LUD domain-containing protein [Deltaproteobacteria bacterium]